MTNQLKREKDLSHFFYLTLIKILMEISTNVVNQGAIDQGSTTQVKKGRKALKIKWKLERKLADNETS